MPQPVATTSCTPALRRFSTPDRDRCDCSATAKCEEETSHSYRGIPPRRNKPPATTVVSLPRKKVPLATAAVSPGKREEISHNYRERINLPQLPHLSSAKEPTSHHYRGFLPPKNKPPAPTLSPFRDRRYDTQPPQLSSAKEQPERVTTNAHPAATTSCARTLPRFSTPDRDRCDCSGTAKREEETSHNYRGIPPRRNKPPASTVVSLPRKKVPLATSAISSGKREEISHNYRGFLPLKNKPPATTVPFSRERRYLPQLPR